MRQNIVVRNSVDADNMPAGGHAHGLGLNIQWQDGPMRLPTSNQQVSANGAFVEDVLEVCQRRIEFYQRSQFACEENDEAITAIGAARAALASRIARREAAGTQGTHEGA